MKSITFFNNKGGVGKTTLACNMASHLAQDLGLSTLVVDLDPQCNATQLLLSDKQWESLYGNRRESASRTVYKALNHIRAGDSTVETDLHLVRSKRFRVDVLAGHPSMSIMEDQLSRAWLDFQAGQLGGARRTLWLSTLLEALDYDLIVLDVGPSLGALNRTVLLGSEGFVTPMAADMFSLYALDNIGEWMAKWAREYDRGRKAVAETSEVGDLSELLIGRPPILDGYLGYTVQQYVTKAMRGSTRSVNAYERYKKQIPERAEGLREYTSEVLTDPDLGLVPNMFSMVPLAQAVHAPIRDLLTSDGVRGAQVSQHARYVERLDEIAARLASNMRLSEE